MALGWVDPEKSKQPRPCFDENRGGRRAKHGERMVGRPLAKGLICEGKDAGLTPKLPGTFQVNSE